MKIYAFYLAVIGLVTATLGIPTFADSFSYNQTSDAQALIGSNSAGAGDSTNTFTVTNSTGTTWTDYAIVVGPPSGFGSDNESYFTSCSGTLSLVTAPGDPGSNTGIYDNQCEITGISIIAGATYTFTVGIGAGEPGWSVYGTPSITSGGGGGGGTTTAPEPTSLLLLGSGLVGLLGAAKYKKIAA
ncbi:MAG TPA: PEP-CTERM sorting domain-containing protein [Candidatus Acidoferrum sp.]|nr:PEP-CTERM sorting domain-containing protein [Candidatus Acidoferrum sp.]